MGLNRRPGKRPGPHAFAAAGSDRADDQPTLVDPAGAGVADLLVAGEVSSAGGAVMAPRNRFLRATARAGNEGVAGARSTAVTVHGATTPRPVLLSQ